jgi:DNA-binding NtrC family response regulator
MSDPLTDIVCISAQMQEVVRLLKTAAPSKVAVLISGEAGVGKDLVAHALHALSPRSSRPFIPVSCWGSADRSVEEELFGTQRMLIKLTYVGNPGSLPLANTGTLLLDEIDALPLPTQVKLLHLLENQDDARLDVRVIATTKDDSLVDKRIRTDLQYFLNTFHIHVPPLRERISDIPVLIDRLLTQINRSNGRVIREVDSEVRNRFQTHPWPGNVREMRSVLEHAALSSTGNLIYARDLPANFGQLPKAAQLRATVSAELSEIRFPLGATVEQVEKELILQTLERTNHNKTRAAELLGISLKTLHNKLTRYKADPGQPNGNSI